MNVLVATVRANEIAPEKARAGSVVCPDHGPVARRPVPIVWARVRVLVGRGQCSPSETLTDCQRAHTTSEPDC